MGLHRARRSVMQYHGPRILGPKWNNKRIQLPLLAITAKSVRARINLTLCIKFKGKMAGVDSYLSIAEYQISAITN